MARKSPKGSQPRPKSKPDSQPKSLYIVSPTYDWLLFLLPPTLALGLGLLVSESTFAAREIKAGFNDYYVSDLFIGIFIHAHLVAVFFRSHGNRQIFATHPRRFLLVPPLLYCAMMTSPWILVSVSVLATFWDVYHSGMQTFGFARIYDMRQGNPPLMGRRLDQWLNQLLYAGPIVAGATMLDHFEDFGEYSAVGSTFFTSIPAWMQGNQRYFTWAILGFGTLFLAYYVFSYVRFHRQGYQVSFLKVFLLVTTGACSIYTWGFNSWGEAFFIMNFFHALQYFGIVWAREKKSLLKLFRVENLKLGVPIALFLFLALPAVYGYWVVSMNRDLIYIWPLSLVVSIMHFWYDGFIWSVRLKQV